MCTLALLRPVDACDPVRGRCVCARGLVIGRFCRFAAVGPARAWSVVADPGRSREEVPLGGFGEACSPGL
ncbi:hypothetical protein ACH4SP_41405 [Streptomyces sp. NPDC021093]|uniref:hypothetical protein n=1 Tax=Streptomyces sp. NPDC021093 TaxID=3365112 RepID=UPI0037A57A48